MSSSAHRPVAPARSTKSTSETALRVEIRTPIPGPKAKRIVEEDQRLLMTGTKSAPVAVASAKGSWITDVDGNRLLDFTSGVGVHNVGHCHPDVVRAVQEQAAKVMHAAGTDYYYESQNRLAQRLIDLTPGDFSKKVFFTNSGTESVEGALKIAKWNRQRPIVVGLLGGFHGRSMGALTVTASRPAQRRRFESFVFGGHHIPAPYCYRCPYKLEYPSCDLYCAKILKELYFETSIPPEDVAAFIAEPVIGEGGYIVPPKGWHRAIKSILDEHGILFIDDEVQAGIGRTGKWFAVEHHGILPDIVTTAKALGGGLPIGAVVFRKELDFTYPGAHSNTFGGNLVAVASALATLEVVEREALLDRATARGAYLLKRLRELPSKHPEIGDVRGLGLMTATEFVAPGPTHPPDTGFRDRLIQECVRRGLVVLPCGRSAIRYIPPLVVTEGEIDQAIEILDGAIGAVRAG
jgi:4-aminobutyrate aminotransferase